MVEVHAPSLSSSTNLTISKFEQVSLKTGCFPSPFDSFQVLGRPTGDCLDLVCMSYMYDGGYVGKGR